MSRLRIGLVAPYVNRKAFGVGVSVGALCDELSKAGHDVTLITGDDPRSSGIPQSRQNGDGKLSVRLFPMRYPWNRRLHRAPGMRRWLRSFVREFDLVDIQGIWSVMAAETGAVCSSEGVPYVITPRGMMGGWDWAKKPLKKRLFFGVMMRKVWRSAAAVRFVSRGEANASMIDANGRGVVIPNFVPPPPAIDRRQEAERLRSKMGISPDAAVVLFLGRVDPQKGVVELVEAFGSVCERKTDAVLLVVGPLEGAYGTAVKERAASLPWARNVRLAGPLFGDDKHAAYAAATLFVTLSKNEGLPVAALEALSHGLPTLLAEDSNLPEVRDYDAGLLTDSRGDGVAPAMLGLLADRERLRVMSANARRLFEERFTSDAVIPRVVSLYESVAGSARPAPRASIP